MSRGRKCISQKEFITRATTKHQNTYDYSKTVYSGALNKVIIICSIHGEFEQKASDHLYGHGCSKCADGIRHGNRLLTTKMFIQKAKLLHDNYYSYENTVYIKGNLPVLINCPIHGQFKQKPKTHLEKRGCRICGLKSRYHGDNSLSFDEIVINARQVHGELYEYDSTDYKNTTTKITILCKIHGAFKQTVGNHIHHKSGCPKCTLGNSSINEIKWLNEMNVPDTIKNRQVALILIDGSKIIADGFMNNTVYEFWGDFWHGNPNTQKLKDINKMTKTTFGELYEKTLIKRQKILQSGYNLIEMWEADWKNLQTNK